MRLITLFLFYILNISNVNSNIFRKRSVSNEDIEVNDIEEEEVLDSFTEEESITYNEDGEEDEEDGDEENEEYNHQDRETDEKEDDEEEVNEDNIIDSDLSILDSLLQSANLEKENDNDLKSKSGIETTDSEGNIIDKSTSVGKMKAALKKSGVSQAKLDNFLVMYIYSIPR